MAESPAAQNNGVAAAVANASTAETSERSRARASGFSHFLSPTTTSTPIKSVEGPKDVGTRPKVAKVETKSISNQVAAKPAESAAQKASEPATKVAQNTETGPKPESSTAKAPLNTIEDKTKASTGVKNVPLTVEVKKMAVSPISTPISTFTATVAAAPTGNSKLQMTTGVGTIPTEPKVALKGAVSINPEVSLICITLNLIHKGQCVSVCLSVCSL